MKKYVQYLYTIAFTFALIVSLSSQAVAYSQEWHKVSFDGVDIAYLDAGKRDAQPLVFIHGWACDSSFWSLQIPDFAKNYRVIAIDLPGFGKSDKPRHISYTLDYFARSVNAVLRDAGAKKPILVGHSMGYAIVRQYLMDYPGVAKAVINVDGAYFRIPENSEERIALEKQFSSMIAAHEGPDRERAVDEFIQGTFYEKTPELLRKKVIASMTSADPFTATSALREMLHLDQWKEVTFDVPSLALYAASSQRSSHHEMYMKTIFPALTYEEWDNAGHFLMLEQPERFNTTVHKFLKALP